MLKRSFILLLPKEDLNDERDKWVKEHFIIDKDIRQLPNLHVTLLYSCVDDLDLLKQFLPSHPIKATFSKTQIDPTGPYVFQMFDDDGLTNVIKLFNKHPLICRSNENYQGPNKTDDKQATDENGTLHSHMSLLIGRTESGHYKWKSDIEKEDFRKKFEPVLDSCPFNDGRTVIFDRVAIDFQYTDGTRKSFTVYF